MNKGRRICDYLKSIRQDIADQNGIEYHSSECNFKGECSGTCPKCDAELIDLQNKINSIPHAKRNLTLAGIALTVSLAGCNNVNGKYERPLAGELKPVCTNDSIIDDNMVGDIYEIREDEDQSIDFDSVAINKKDDSVKVDE